MKRQANLYKRHGSPFFYYRFKKGSAVYRGSTGCVEVRKALDVLAQKKSDVLDGVVITPKSAMTVGEWLATNPHHKIGKRDSSIERDQKALDRMRTSWEHRRMIDIRTVDCEKLMKQRSTSVRPASLERDRVVWTAAFEKAVDRGVLDKNPWKKVDRMFKKRIKARERIVTSAEEALLRLHLDPSMQRFLTVALGTGMRVGELVTLRPMDVREGKIHVRAEVTKADEARQIGVRADVAEALAAQTPSAPDLPYWPLPTQAIRERLAEASRMAEIPRVYPHALRKTMATRCAVKGFPLVMLQKILGHSSPTVTAKFYVGIDDSARAHAFVALAL